MTESVRYFHGGGRGLKVGGYILPPSLTKVWSTPDYGEMGGLHRKDRVYLTTELVDAQFFAAASQDPTVYEVEPIGTLEDDPDCRRPGRSYACEKAKIIAIHRVPGKSIKKARKKMLLAKSPQQRPQR
jgi:hypothetical protein